MVFNSFNDKSYLISCPCAYSNLTSSTLGIFDYSSISIIFSYFSFGDCLKNHNLENIKKRWNKIKK